MDNNIVKLDQSEGVEIFVNTATKESFTSIRGYARLTGKTESTIARQLSNSVREEAAFAKVETDGGLQKIVLIPATIEDLLKRYHQSPTQILYKNIRLLYQHQGISADGLDALHELNKGNKSGKAGRDREKQIQLAYHARYGGTMEFPTANGRIDLLTDEAIYEFKIFRSYKECLGQLLAYDDCIPQLKLIAVLFGVPKALQINGKECVRVKTLLSKYGIDVRFLR